MNTKLFLGLTLNGSSSFGRSIQSLRSRYDEWYRHDQSLFIALIPPFEILQMELKNFKMELAEELDSFFYENTANHRLTFTGIDAHEHKRLKVLSLKPLIDEDLALCQESLKEIAKNYDVNKKIKDFRPPFLTLGQFQSDLELHQVISLAQKEITEFSSLPFESVALFQKKNNIWYRLEDLCLFDKSSSFLS